MATEAPLYYLSFASDEGFLGCCFVHAAGQGLAPFEAKRLGCNPGGEVLSFVVPPEQPQPRPDQVGRLLGAEELRTIWPDVKKLSEWKDEGWEVPE